jgi:hypothetical protein
VIVSLRRLTYEKLKQQLGPDDRIIVFACNNCAKKCKGFGGRQGMANLCAKLEADGIAVLHKELCGITCSVDLVNKRKADEATRAVFEQANVIIPLACENGERTLRYVFPDKKVLETARPVGLGWGSPKVGVRIVVPFAGVPLKVDSPEGITLDEAAKKLGLFAGSF